MLRNIKFYDDNGIFAILSIFSIEFKLGIISNKSTFCNAYKCGLWQSIKTPIPLIRIESTLFEIRFAIYQRFQPDSLTHDNVCMSAIERWWDNFRKKRIHQSQCSHILWRKIEYFYLNEAIKMPFQIDAHTLAKLNEIYLEYPCYQSREVSLKCEKAFSSWL